MGPDLSRDLSGWDQSLCPGKWDSLSHVPMPDGERWLQDNDSPISVA